MHRHELVDAFETKNGEWAAGECMPHAGAPSRLRDALSHGLKRTLRSVWEIPLLGLVRNHYAGLGSCLLYHRIAPGREYVKDWSAYRGLSVAKEDFEDQLRYINDNYNCVSLPEAVELLSEGQLPPKTIVVTFDDGYKDNLSIALPLLEKYEIPATIYITTGLIDRTEELWWFEHEFIIQNCTEIDFCWNGHRYAWSVRTPQEKFQTLEYLNKLFKKFRPKQQRSFMESLREMSSIPFAYDNEVLTWDEVVLLDKHPLITIGAHTISHPMLSLLHKQQVDRGLQESKERLEDRLGHSIDHFAYPFGGRDEIGVSEFVAAKRSGFRSAVTTRHGHIYGQHNDYLHVLPRISVNIDDQIESFAWKLSGLHCLLQQFGQRMVVG